MPAKCPARCPDSCSTSALRRWPERRGESQVSSSVGQSVGRSIGRSVGRSAVGPGSSSSSCSSTAGPVGDCCRTLTHHCFPQCHVGLNCAFNNPPASLHTHTHSADCTAQCGHRRDGAGGAAGGEGGSAGRSATSSPPLPSAALPSLCGDDNAQPNDEIGGMNSVHTVLFQAACRRHSGHDSE